MLTPLPRPALGLRAPTHPSSDGYNDRATAKLLGAALGGDSGDVEIASSGIAAAFEPSWIVRTEKIKGEMAVLRERMNKLREWVAAGAWRCGGGGGGDRLGAARPTRALVCASWLMAQGRPLMTLPPPPRPLVIPRYHAKSLLVTFDSDNGAAAHVDALTREVKASFKRLDVAVRGMDKAPPGGGDVSHDEDAQVGSGAGPSRGGGGLGGRLGAAS